MQQDLAKQYPHPLATVDEDRHQLPSVFATATVACVYDRFFIVTPKHALAGLCGKAAFLLHSGGLLSLERKAVVTAAEFDLATIELQPHEVDEIATTTLFVVEEQILPSEPLESHCVLQGYPANRNSMKIRGAPFNRELLQITTRDITGTYDDNTENFGLTRIAFDYDERNIRDAQLRKMSSRNLAGMSGGMFAGLRDDGDNKRAFVKGILLEQDKLRRALIALRYDIIVMWIKCNMVRFPACES